MPKHEKGILGVKKDPKNQILFSFNVRDGEEWPSDEDDSDYDPGHGSDSDNEPRTSKKSKKKPAQSQKGKKGIQKKSKSTRKRKSTCTYDNGSDVKVARVSIDEYKGKLPQLPTEIWLKIFHNVTNTEGAIPFVLHAEKVCRQWKAILDHPKLWQTVDLSYGWMKFKEASFKKFCRNRLTECTHLNVSGCPIMSKPSAVQAIAENCPKLKVLNLSRCNKLPNDSVVTIVNGCRLLEDIDLSGTTTDSVSSQTLCHTIDKCGPNLRRLVLSTNIIRGFNSVLNNIMEKCPNLEHLDVSNVNFSSGFISIDIERFQQSCPKLQTLGLANSSFRASTASSRVQEQSTGFPDLEEISLATNEDIPSAVVEEVVVRLLKSSTKLRLLDMRGCKNSGAVAVLDSIPATNLEQLHLSRSAVAQCQNLHNILSKWRHSLTDLDLSWNNFTGGILELALVTLCGRGEPHAALVNLNLAGTHVTMDVVRKLLDSLPNLCKLDLTSCREVLRGCKREYKTRAELEKLRDSL